MPEALRRDLEAFFGAGFADVRVHEGPRALAFQSLALAAGSELFFAPGCFQPDTAPGRHLIAHELAHVLQQRAGRVPHDGSEGPCLVEDPALEAEANRAANAFVSGRRLPDVHLLGSPAPRPAGRVVLQPAKVKLVDPKQTTRSPFKNEYEKYLYDYTLIQTWLTDKAYFVPALKALDAELARSADTQKKLTNVLLKREQFHGLNREGAPIYTAVLSGPEFVAMNKKGVLPKDHVTPDHGEFTHRLHWYIVLHNATKGFTKQPASVFYNGVLPLLMKTTQRVYKPPKENWPILEGTKDSRETDTLSMWEALFDRRPFPGLYSIQEDWLTCPEMFTALLVPKEVEFNNYYRNLQGKETLTDVAPLLSAEVTRRYVKRQSELKEHGNSQGAWAAWYSQKKAQDLKTKIVPKLGVDNAFEVQFSPPDYKPLEVQDKVKGKVESKAVLVRK
ncbi:uncharacterized protein DUF4157 [Archangium gephyra]|uniref:Uncharacterized protein DUF4157 n=1 Tax=Archangium gephyra TaxID=48 RepID=A0ABX9JN56_9BACT|nr:LirA/MavJ family T4SS effector [Archangium gephyra]REG22893.1 uncharacterized protein DUF4157 [Archangium gephyra]